jgi:regulator of sigma E protease
VPFRIFGLNFLNMDFLIKAAQLILSLSIIVVLHEFGHFLPAKYFKTRVEKFYLFFDPWFSIWKKKIGDTVYGLGWLPLGGYVKISGMVDESMDRDQMNSEPEPWEFRAKPSWQRLIIITGGVFVNLVLGMLIYAMLMFIWGTEKLPVRNATYGYQVDSTLMEFGFQNGDIPIRFGQQEPEYFSDLGKTMILSDSRDVEVLREGRTVNFKLPEDWKDKVLDENKRGLFALQVPFIVDTIIPGGTAAQSDLQKGDRIVGFNDIETPYFSTFRNKIGDFKDKTIQLKVERNGQAITLPVNVNSKGLLGVGNTNPIDYFEFETLNYTFLRLFRPALCMDITR